MIAFSFAFCKHFTQKGKNRPAERQF